MIEARTPRSTRKGRLATLLLLGLFVLGVWGALTVVDTEQGRKAVARLGTGQVLAILGLASLHYVLRALRWHVLSRAIGLPLSLGKNFLIYFGGFAMTATPGRLGELVRVRWMCLATGWKVDRVASVALGDRAIELIGMLFVIILAMALMNSGIAGASLLLTISFVLVVVALNTRLLAYLVTLTWRATGARPRLFARLRRMIKWLRPFTKAPVLIPTSIISAAGWFMEGLALHLLLVWLGFEISLAAATAIFLVAILSGALSGLPGGLGSTEAVCVALLSLQGVPLDVSLVATIVMRVATLWYAVAMGAAAFLYAEVRFRQQ